MFKKTTIESTPKVKKATDYSLKLIIKGVHELASIGSQIKKQ